MPNPRTRDGFISLHGPATAFSRPWFFGPNSGTKRHGIRRDNPYETASSLVRSSPATSSHPAIAITVTDREDSRALQRMKERILRAKALFPLLLEIRIDRFRRLEEPWVLEKLRSFKRLGLPLLATIRSRAEGGGRFLSDAKRFELFKTILPRVDGVDLELSSKRLVRRLVPLAHRQRKGVILSYHNFKATPSERILTRMIRKGKKEGADWVKLAVRARRKEDLVRLLHLTYRYRKEGVIALALGAQGAPSRLLAPLFGSRVTYTFLTRPQAPGQLPFQHLFQEMSVLLPLLNRRRKR